MLNRPALTGLDPDDLRELAAALEVPFGAHREQQVYARRGGRRVNAIRNGDGSNGRRRTGLLDHVLALRLRDHLGAPATLVGALLGVDRTTAGHAVTLARQLIAENGIPLPSPAQPPGTRPRTPADLREYADAAGIDLAIPETAQTPRDTQGADAPNLPTRPRRPTK
jgi:hypothetical protein